VYYFDVNSAYLQPALDRFSQFFVAPLFTASATDRELNAIESEHSKNINNDGFRIYQLERDCANPEHPLHKFATGNLQTLSQLPRQQGIDTRARLLQFHSTYYSAPKMTLCVLGREPLADLQQWVSQMFATVPDRHSPSPELQWWGRIVPYCEMLPPPSSSARELQPRDVRVLQVVPVDQGTSYLAVTWSMWVRSPSERAELQAASPSLVVADLLGHEGKGSVRALLLARGWINAVQAAVSTDIADLQEFTVHVDLTEEGLRHTDEIIAVLFAYLRLLKATGVPEYVYQELQQLSAIGFEYAEKAEVSSYVSSVAANMQNYRSPRQYLTGGKLFYPDLCKPLLGRYLDSLLQSIEPFNPQPSSVDRYNSACRVTMVSGSFAGSTDQTGPFYGTQYSNSSASEESLRLWRGLRAAAILQDGLLRLPQPNPFVPTDFRLVADPSEAIVATAFSAPTVIRRDDKWTLWHELDRTFRQPKVHLVVSLAVPQSLYGSSDAAALFVVNGKLFSQCLLESDLNEKLLYEANLAGLNFQLDLTSKGLQMVISGFSDKLPLFAERVCQAVRDFSPDQTTFTRVRELLRRDYLAWDTQQPYSHCAYFAGLASETLQFPIQSLREALQRATWSMQQGFIGSMLRGGSQGTALIVGNIQPAGAQQLLAIVERAFPFAPLSVAQQAVKRVLLYPALTQQRGTRIARDEPNPSDANSATSFYFQLPSTDPARYMALELLAELVEQPFYNSLRTQQQLGYIVFSGIKVREGGLRYLTFIVQSSVADGPRLTAVVERFLDTELPGLLSSLDDERLQTFKDSIAVRKLEPDQRLTQRAGRYWAEISAALSREILSTTAGSNSSALSKEASATGIGEPLFQRAQLEVQQLQHLDLAGFKRFARELLSPGSPERRLLVSQVTSTSAKDSESTQSQDVGGFAEVLDLQAFVRNQPFV